MTDSLQALTERLRSAELNARRHALRATFFERALREREAEIALIRGSTSWRLSAPVRLFGRALRQSPATTGRAAVRYFVRALQKLSILRCTDAAGFSEAVRRAYEAPARGPAHSVVAPRVLIIGELSLPQCAKYRVWQKQEFFRRLGTECTVFDWRKADDARSALQTHAMVIFYRVPGLPEAMPLFEEARRLRITSYWEVDDLIFDTPVYLKNRNLDTLDPQLRSEVLSGVAHYRRGLLACDRAIASTPALAQAMRDAGVAEVIVIENALDGETMELARQIRARQMQAPRVAAGDDTVVIGYGSGSKAHSADFLEAASALACLMRDRPRIELQIMGDLTLPAELNTFENRIRRLPAAGYAAYLEWLAGCDIALAPLENTAFNQAKSNIKYIEAAILAIPSVCSPLPAFQGIMDHGKNGFLAATTAEWCAALESLTASVALRRSVGAAAYANVLSRYAPELAQSQLTPLVQDLDQRARKKITVLAVNVFFWPQSYGGATIVAEELARRLSTMSDIGMHVFTSNSMSGAQPYSLSRYTDPSSGEEIPVFAVCLPRISGHPVMAFDDPQIASRFNDVLAAVQPDIVHFHCLQGLSSVIMDTCQERSIPYVVTVHDAWWLCERQFMVQSHGRYCGQTRIDVRICENCIPGAQHLHERYEISIQRLSSAARLLFPSAFHRNLHIANGIDPSRCVLNRNGVRPPARPRPPLKPGVLRFGYVGGNDRVKGIHLVKAAFEGLDRTDFKLVLVDNTINAGYSSMDARHWRMQGELQVVPAYRQDTMDAFFESIDVLLFPSQWKESFGLTVREALVRDVWVIATDGGGTVEDIVQDVNGTILPFHATPQDLRAAVVALLDRPDRLAGHSNPYKHQITTYEAQARELHGILLDVLSDQSGVESARRPVDCVSNA